MILKRFKESGTERKGNNIDEKKSVIVLLFVIFVLFLIGGNALAGLIDTEEVMMTFPEPAVMLLLGSGFVGISAIGRKKLIRK